MKKAKPKKVTLNSLAEGMSSLAVEMKEGFAFMHTQFKSIDTQFKEVRNQLKTHTDKLSSLMIKVDGMDYYIHTGLSTKAEMSNYAGGVDRCIVDTTRVNREHIMHGDRIGRLETDSEKHEKDIRFLKSKVAA